MSYTADPTDPTMPTPGAGAGYMYLELQALKQYIASLSKFRNLLLNGTFQINQSGAVYNLSAGVAQYTVDQWAMIINAGTATVTQISAAAFQYLKINLSAAVTSAALFQSMEAARSGPAANLTTMTVSGYINVIPSTGITITPVLKAATATNNFSTVTTVATGVPIVYTAGTVTYWEQQLTLTADAVAGLQLVLEISSSETSSVEIDFWSVQLEYNSFGSPPEIVPYSDDLAACQRFYRVQTFANTKSMGATGGYNQFETFISGPAMFGTPTVTYFGGTGNTPSAATGFNSAGFYYVQLEFPITANEILQYSGNVLLTSRL